MEIIVVLVLVFAVMIFLAWGALFHGKTWFMKRTQRVVTEVESNLADLFIFINTQKVAGLSALAVFVLPLVVYLISQNVLLTAVSVPLAFMLPRLWVGRMRTKRLHDIESQLPDALLMMSGALRAGASFHLESAALPSDNGLRIGHRALMAIEDWQLDSGFGETLQTYGLACGIGHPTVLMQAAAQNEVRHGLPPRARYSSSAHLRAMPVPTRGVLAPASTLRLRVLHVVRVAVVAEITLVGLRHLVLQQVLQLERYTCLLAYHH